MLWNEFIRGRTIRRLCTFCSFSDLIFLAHAIQLNGYHASCIFPASEREREKNNHCDSRIFEQRKKAAQLWRVWTSEAGIGQRKKSCKEKKSRWRMKEQRSGGDYDGDNGGSHRSKCEFSIFKTLQIMHLPAACSQTHTHADIFSNSPLEVFYVPMLADVNGKADTILLTAQFPEFPSSKTNCT